jgi:hypothetical protein
MRMGGSEPPATASGRRRAAHKVDTAREADMSKAAQIALHKRAIPRRRRAGALVRVNLVVRARRG